ncbi:GDSL esterase/lipase At5g03810 [Linum grandiflorum]
MGTIERGAAVLVLILAVVTSLAIAEPLVPSLIIFGDSIADVGNNNNLTTIIKANFPPYGRDFVTHTPTGRFSNGKLAIDFTADYLGFDTYPPPYLSQQGRSGESLTGVNFASAGSGLYDPTALLYGAIPLTLQLSYYRAYQARVVSILGSRERASDIFSKGIHLLSAGTSDFIQNYYINPLLYGVLTPDRFSDLLMRSYSSFIQNLYRLGVRRIGVTSLPPLGCLPAAITLFGLGSNQCVERLNRDASSYNQILNRTSQNLVAIMPDLKLVVFDIYQPLLNLIGKPSDSGFFEARRACCGTGTLETSVLCNARAMGTCSNATQYVFWDGFHPSEAANEVLAQSLLEAGISLIS